MSTVHVSNKLSFLHGENSAAAGKSPERRQNPAAEILGHAAEVYISAKGKALSESDDRDADLTPAEAALAANERERADKHAKKVQAEENADDPAKKGKRKGKSAGADLTVSPAANAAVRAAISRYAANH